MPRRQSSVPDDDSYDSNPESTPDAREAQLIYYADQLAERQLREGTASAQVITHFLKLGSSRERIEQEKLRVAIELDKAKATHLASQEDQAQMFANAIRAMSMYQGRGDPDQEAGGEDAQDVY